MLRKEYIGLAEWALCGLMCVVLSLMLFGFTFGLYNLLVSVAIVGALIVGILSFRCWTAIDWLVTVIVLYDVVSPFYSVCRIPAIKTASTSLIVWALYMLLRRLFGNRRIAHFFIQWIGLVSALSAAVAIGVFFISFDAAGKVGFCDMYPLRYLYRPFGYTNNYWAEIALLMVGIGCLCRRYSGVIVCLATASALLTFSRGIYVSFAVLSSVLIIFVRPISRIRNCLLGIIVAIVAVAAFFPHEVMTTISMNSLVSQRNSIEWRKNSTMSAMDAFGDSPVIGFGNNSYSLITDSGEISEAFTEIAPNLPAQILVEKGLFGAVVWLLLLVAIMFFVVRNRKKYSVVVCGSVLLAILVKELSQSGLTYIPLMSLLTIVVLAYMQRRACCVESQSRRLGFAVALLLTPCFMRTHIVEATREKYCMELKEILSNFNIGNVKVAMYHADKIDSGYDPYINTLNALLCLQSGQYDEAYDLVGNHDDSISLWIKGCVMYHKNNKNEARKILSSAIILMPSFITTVEFEAIKNDDNDFYCSILSGIDKEIKCDTPETIAKYGYILYYTGRRQQAMDLLKSAVVVAPAMRTPWLLLGEKEKYDFLLKGGLCVDPDSESTNSDLRTSVSKMFLRNYYDRCVAWYAISGVINH